MIRTRLPVQAQWRSLLRALGPLVAAVGLGLVAALQPVAQAQEPSPGPALIPTEAAEPPKPDQRFVIGEQRQLSHLRASGERRSLVLGRRAPGR